VHVREVIFGRFQVLVGGKEESFPDSSFLRNLAMAIGKYFTLFNRLKLLVGSF
jgi:hypothetical protein